MRKLKGLQRLLLAPEADAFGEERHRKVLRTFEEEAAQFLAGLGGRNQHPAVTRQNEHLSIPRHPYFLRKLREILEKGSNEF